MVAKDKFVEEGYMAFWQGACVKDNPYDHYLFHPQHELWEEGFYNAADKELDMEP